MLALYIHNPSMYIQNRDYSLNGRNEESLVNNNNITLDVTCIIKQGMISDKDENEQVTSHGSFAARPVLKRKMVSPISGGQHVLQT